MWFFLFWKLFSPFYSISSCIYLFFFKHFPWWMAITTNVMSSPLWARYIDVITSLNAHKIFIWLFLFVNVKHPQHRPNNSPNIHDVAFELFTRDCWSLYRQQLQGRDWSTDETSCSKKPPIAFVGLNTHSHTHVKPSFILGSISHYLHLICL